MSNHRWIKIVGVGLLISLMIAISIISVRGQGLQQVSPEDAQAIETLIARSLELEAQAAYMLDGSVLSEVYINDPRGGEMDEKTLELIQYVRQDKALTVVDVGVLDARQAYILWLKQGIEKREAIFATMQAENREQMTPEESASLVDETGRIAMFNRHPDPATLPKPYYSILSMDVQGDVATVSVDYGSVKGELFLVKIDGRWYIAGGRTLEVTG